VDDSVDQGSDDGLPSPGLDDVEPITPLGPAGVSGSALAAISERMQMRGCRCHGGEDLLRRMREFGQFDAPGRQGVLDCVRHGPNGADGSRLADALGPD
jgi:hypothetical protein